MSIELALRLSHCDISPEVVQWAAAGLARFLKGECLEEALQLDRVSLLRQRNQALIRAASYLDQGDGCWHTAGRLAGAIKRFEARTLPNYLSGVLDSLSPVDSSLLIALGTGCRVPKTQRKLYDLLR